MLFREVRHQERALSILRRGMRAGRTHHAYLFIGPDGVGKGLVAAALAQRLLCEAPGLLPDADACGMCRSCLLMAAGNHPDFHLVHRGLHKSHPDRAIRSSKGLFLVVDVVRHFLIEPANLAPSLGKRRVFVVRDAERMNEEAQNALLKTMEEPPGSACLILVTSSADRLLPTIRSRAQSVPFDLLPRDFVQQELTTGGKLAPDEARTLACLSQGRLGAALHWRRIGVMQCLAEAAGAIPAALAGDPESFGKRLVESATSLAQRTLADAAGATEEGGAEESGDSEAEEEDAQDETSEASARGKAAAKSVPTDALRDAFRLVLLLVSTVYRDALVLAVGAPPAARFLAEPLAERLARDQAPELLSASIVACSEAERMIDRNVQPQLACERLSAVLSGALLGR